MSNGKMRHYITVGQQLLQEKGHRTIVLKVCEMGWVLQ